MAEFEIRDIAGNWRRAKFSKSSVDPDDEIACGLLLRQEIRDRKLPGSPDAYYLRAKSTRRGWQNYRAS